MTRGRESRRLNRLGRARRLCQDGAGGLNGDDGHFPPRSDEGLGRGADPDGRSRRRRRLCLGPRPAEPAAGLQGGRTAIAYHRRAGERRQRPIHGGGSTHGAPASRHCTGAVTSRTTRRCDRDIVVVYACLVVDFSIQQAEQYYDGLIAVFGLLPDNPRMAKERPEFRLPIRLHACKSQTIVCVTEPDGILIVRVLHGRQGWVISLS